VAATTIEQLVVPRRPTVRGSVRTALTDFYFNSIRLVAANVVWGIGLIAVLVLFASAPLIFAVVAAIALALPTAGIFRIAAIIARDQPADLSDAFNAMRSHLLPALAVGALVIGCLTVLGFNFVVGLMSGDPLWLLIGTLAGWGLLLLFVGTSAFWPLLMDPVRKEDPLKQKAQLAFAVIFSSPGRYLGLTLINGAILIVSTIAFAALITISIAFVALTLCRYVLPTADRLEGRATFAEPILD